MSTRTCRRCDAAFRPERTVTTDKRGRATGYAESAWPWCPLCTEILDLVLATVAKRQRPALCVVGRDGRRRPV